MVDSPTPQGALQRIAGFRFIYIGIFVYVFLSLATIEGTEALLDTHFARVTESAARLSPDAGPVIPVIQERVAETIGNSVWTRYLGVRVNAIVLGADGRTPIYLGGRTLPPPPLASTEHSFAAAMRLLPAIVSVEVSVPIDSLLAGCIWVAFGAILVPVLFRQQGRLAREEQQLFDTAVTARDDAAARARSIQTELEKIRGRLDHLEPAERAHLEEISGLQAERASLQTRLAELAAREEAVRRNASAGSDLQSEREALEDLLEDAVRDLEVKESEISELHERLRVASKGGGRSRARTAEQLAKRIRTLYPNLEMDDRAVQDLARLGDESLRLRAEESLKKLDGDPDSAAVRRKVGGLPNHLSIFELGFAGKGRIYYARGKARPYRVLAIGGKASQKSDLDYLSRLRLA
ncbi:MAG: hypothetical protein VX546_13620 [Myxococcota bacterium]|nr:hypothetical protein [Myxococcota bacterium]